MTGVATAAQKRRAAAGLPHLPAGPNVPVPAPPAVTRQAAGWGYVGISVFVPGGGRAATWAATQPPPGWKAEDS